MREKRKTMVKILLMLLTIGLIAACSYYVGFDPVSGQWFIKFWYIGFEDNPEYNSLTFYEDGTFKVEKVRCIFGGVNGTQTWSQDDDNVTLNASGSDEMTTKTSKWDGTLYDSDTSTPSRAEGTFIYTIKNGMTDTMEGKWEMRKTPYNEGFK